MSLIEELHRAGELTSDQYDTVIDTHSEVLCLACAGSGKSRTLAFRIARLVHEGAAPESIIAFTFTEKAAESIKRRVADALEKCGLPVAMVGAMYIGTIHSYCQHLLGSIHAQSRQDEVLDENRLKLYLLSRYTDLDLKSLRDSRGTGQFKTIAEISNAWKMANDEMLSLDAIEQEDPLLGRCLKTLSDRLESEQYIDFSLMIRKAVEALESNNNEVNNALADAKHLMVDEYQDVNVSQERLIAGLYQRMESLFVVGDDDQAIYGWRGADVRNIVEFEQRYPDCSVHTLSTNFRSTETIVSASDRFIQLELSTARIDKTPRSHNNGNVHQFGNFWFESRIEEAQWVASRIRELIGIKYVEGNGVERGLTYSDIAILMRSVQGGDRNGGGQHHRDYTNALQEAGIRYLIEAEGSVFERLHARVVRDAMELLRSPGIPRNEATSFFQSNIRPVFPNADLNKFLAILSDWNNQIHRPQGGARRKVYPQMLVHQLLEAFNVSTTEFENKEQVMRDLGVFSGIILDVEKVFVSIDSSFRYQTVLNFLQHVAETGYDTSQVELMSRPDAVTISTVHKMKGLEYPVIFLVDIVQQRFPGRNSNYAGWLPTNLIQDILSRGLYQGNNAGEARLFYTALTRAERILYVTGGAIHAGLQRPKNQSPYKLRLTNLGHEGIVTDSNVLPDNHESIEPRQRIDEESMPTSFTEIKDYLECPMKYRFRKIYGFSPAVPELFGYGLTTHTAINRLHQLHPNDAPTREEAEEIAGAVFHLKHVFPARNQEAEGPYERAKNASKRLVGSYANDYPQDFIQSRSLEQRFEIKAGKALITGAIDLLLKEDAEGNILEAKVVDFKSMDFPEDQNTPFFWINLALQVQLYAHAAEEVLGQNAKTGAVHLLKADNTSDSPNRVNVPVTDDSVRAAVTNVEWAVNRILEQEFPMRPSAVKCGECDFVKICAKNREDFVSAEVPSPIRIPNINGVEEIRVRCFSDVN
jgi:DNA helicase-2/ATP-dependent DNA helicase PcrA